ncbi:MAG: hypothetical protein Q4G62_01990 [Pseudomonadota bacterium]|nr:hypothetical protein [Pseudomonadota bacterium]
MSTLGFTGMDNPTKDVLSTTFAEAARRRQLDLIQIDGDAADYVVVDMDSLYGPMSWLQLHNAGRKVIGYTSATRSQTHYTLRRGFDSAAVDALLDELDLPLIAQTSQATAAAQPDAQDAAPIPPAERPAQTRAEIIEDDAPSSKAASATHATPQTEPATATQDSNDLALHDWLMPGKLGQPVRLAAAGQVLYIDPRRNAYIGPATLKPLQALLETALEASNFTPIDSGEWAQALESTGSAQPLSRLRWYAALLAGDGQLLPPFKPDDKFRMTKWVQTEREFPKHFRIATAMMKGPANLAEIATAATVSEAEAADFLNACVTIGVTQPVLPEPINETNAARGQLFSRLRGE